MNAEAADGPMWPTNLTDGTALEIAALLRRCEISAAEVVDAFIARVEAVNPAPLLGVPFTVKDNFWIEGWVVSQGSALFADLVAPAVARPRRVLGAVRAVGRRAADRRAVGRPPLRGRGPGAGGGADRGRPGHAVPPSQADAAA